MEVVLRRDRELCPKCRILSSGSLMPTSSLDPVGRVCQVYPTEFSPDCQSNLLKE